MHEQTPNVAACSPLQLREKSLGQTAFAELPLCTKISLRGNAEDQVFTKVVSDVLADRYGRELELPKSSNVVVSTDLADSGKMSAFWMGPDEWLLRVEGARHQSSQSGDESSDISAQLNESLQGLHSAVVDVSDYYTVLRLHGEHSAGILARSCPLDLESSFSEAGRCAQTRVGNAAVLLDSDDRLDWCIQVRWSYADYLWQLIERSAISFV